MVIGKIEEQVLNKIYEFEKGHSRFIKANKLFLSRDMMENFSHELKALVYNGRYYLGLLIIEVKGKQKIEVG